jgi:hypothetical protein
MGLPCPPPPRGAWTRIERESFEREVEAVLSEVESRISAACAAKSRRAAIRFTRFSMEVRLFSRGMEPALPFPIPRGPVYGSEAILVIDGREVPLDAAMIVGMYDEASGEGVIFEDEWVEAQLEELGRVARDAVGNMAYR